MKQALIEVRNSPVHGSGVFALRKIRKGSTIIEYLGDRVTHEEVDERYADKLDTDSHTFLFTVNSKIVIDAGSNGNDARFINHSCDPNCESTIKKKRVFIEAIRTIQPGEELNYDYAIGRDDDDAANVDEIFACRCGAANCRGSMLEPRKKPRKRANAAQSRSPPRAPAARREREGRRLAQLQRAAKRPGAAAQQRELVDADGAVRADDLIDGLRADGIAVRDGFLSASQVKALIDCAAARRGRGEFAHARIGAGRSLQRRADIRGDSICWLEEPLLPAEQSLFASLEATGRGLNRGLYLGLHEIELHYACYPAGTGYARHIDQPQGHAARRLSSIVYLTEDWCEADGGLLRCAADGGGFREIEPRAGRLVLFLTEGREHEVLRTSRERLSITGWYLGRPEHALR